MSLDPATVRRIASLARIRVEDDEVLRLREDAVTDGGYPEKILANAPDREGDFFAVPKVVE